MAIDTGIPSASTLLVPGFYFTVSPATSGNVAAIQRVLIIGQITSIGAAVGTPQIASDIDTVSATYGYGSMLANMYRKYRASDPTTEVWLLPLADAVGATSGSVAVTISGSPTIAGVLSLYIAGQLVTVPVAAGASATTIAAAISTAANVNVYLPCTASAAAGVVTLTAKSKGLVAGDITVNVNLLGATAGEVTPLGLQVAVAATPGAGDPDLTAGLASLGDKAFDIISFPYAAASACNEVSALLNAQSGRWSYVQQLFGFGMTAAKGTLATLEAEGNLLNSQFISVLGSNSPEPVSDIAAAYAGAAAASLTDDVALPLQAIPLNLVAAPLGQRFVFSDRNALLLAGISTARTDDFGGVILERCVTTYKQNALGLADDSYRDVETIFELSYVIRYIRAQLSTKFARVKLVADGTRIAYGSNFVTSRDVLAELIAAYRNLASVGIVSDPSTFARAASAENGGQGRVNIIAPIVLANQLRQIAVKFAFSKA